MRLDVMRGEKIAIIGPNGVGKSSLLKAIQELIPLEEGSFEWGQKVKTTYYEQENRQLHPEKTAINEISEQLFVLDKAYIKYKSQNYITFTYGSASFLQRLSLKKTLMESVAVMLGSAWLLHERKHRKARHRR